jgi:hypothetical protein
MKRFIILSIFLLVVSLACQTVQRVVAPATPTVEASPLPEPTLSATVAVTEASESAASPTVMRVAPTPITCTDDSCLDACLSRINDELSTQPQNEIGGEYAGTDSNFNLVTYKVNGDQISEPDVLWVPSEYKLYQQDTGAHQRVWEYFVSLIPAEQRKWIKKYTIFTDGNSNTLAWVGKQNYDDNSRWELGVDLLDATDPIYLTETLAHEVAHLVTLNSDQIIQSEDFIYTPYQNTAVCSQFISTEGCSTPESYINAFYRKFWFGIYEDWLETVYNANPSNEEEFFQAVGEFYSRYSEQFARPYAATNIREDLAVSFEYFVLHPKSTGGGISAQKMRFFYDYPELVALRQQMIQAMCSYAQ